MATYDAMIQALAPGGPAPDAVEHINALNAKAKLAASPEEKLALYDAIITLSRRIEPKARRVMEQAILDKVAVLRGQQ
jgi:hypothetical protein